MSVILGTMERLDDDLLFYVLMGWQWPRVVRPDGDLTLGNSEMFIVMQISRVSRRWCRLARDRLMNRLTLYGAPEDHLALTDTGCAMMPKLRCLWLASQHGENKKVTTAQLTCMTCINEIHLGNHALIDDTVVLPLFTKLTILNLWSSCPVHDTTLCLMTWLTDLTLCENVAISDTGLALMPQLQYLSLGKKNNTITGTAFTALTSLEWLDIGDHAVVMLDNLQLLPSLTHLNVRDVHILDPTYLYALTQLRSLDIGFLPIEMNFFFYCSRMPLLETLIIDVDLAHDTTDHVAIEKLRARGVSVFERKWDFESEEEPEVVEVPQPACSVQ